MLYIVLQRIGKHDEEEISCKNLGILLEEPTTELDYDSLWCAPLFQNPERVRNVSLADARPVQQRLAEHGITAKVLGTK